MQAIGLTYALAVKHCSPWARISMGTTSAYSPAGADTSACGRVPTWGTANRAKPMQHGHGTQCRSTFGIWRHPAPASRCVLTWWVVALSTAPTRTASDRKKHRCFDAVHIQRAATPTQKVPAVKHCGFLPVRRHVPVDGRRLDISPCKLRFFCRGQRRAPASRSCRAPGRPQTMAHWP